MKDRLKSLLIALLTVAILNTGIPGAVQASTAAAVPTAARQLSFSSSKIPSLGELQIGSISLSVERVRNGVIVRNLATEESVVLTLAEVAEYQIVDERQNPDGSVELAFVRPDPFGAPQRVEMRLSEMTGFNFAGQLSRGETTVPFAYTSFSDDLRQIGSSSAAGSSRVSGEAIFLVIVVSAAVVTAVGCSAAALLTNCIRDCADACWSCGQCSMESASEGLCGTCTCTCSCGGDRRFFSHDAC